MKKPIPEFKNEDEEREFWATHDSNEYLDWSKSRRALFPNLKPTTRAISLRLPTSMLDELRQMANQRDVPYQSLIKVFLRERIDSEHQSKFVINERNTQYKAKRTKSTSRGNTGDIQR